LSLDGAKTRLLGEGRFLGRVYPEMVSFAAARRYMVDGQLRINDVTDPRVIGAFQSIPRERFISKDRSELAYLDIDLPVSDAAPAHPARFLLKPLVLAKLIDIAGVREHDRVLDVGCATGYSTAVLAGLASHVMALEENSELAEKAEANCRALDCSNVTVLRGPMAEGAPGDGPYDVILINGAVEFVPELLSAQLAEGGRLVCVLRQGPVGKGMVYLRAEGTVSGRSVFDGAAPLLPGFVRTPAFTF
jgi:protein-L-isoaspartate(D-aspartate) O-methyltransferase